MKNSSSKIYDLNEAREKIRAYCLYRERSQQEVNAKLESYGLIPEVRDTLISELIQERYLDEERFARAFVRGKYKIKKWGRYKIKQALYPHKLSEYVLKKAFSEIDPDLYYRNLLQVCEKRWPLSKGANAYQRKLKLRAYLQNRGFESDLVQEAIREVVGD